MLRCASLSSESSPKPKAHQPWTQKSGATAGHLAQLALEPLYQDGLGVRVQESGFRS